MRSLYKNKYILAAVSMLIAMASTAPNVYAVDTAASSSSVHAKITKDALAETLAPANLKAVIEANESQDTLSDAQKEKRRHFEGNGLQSAVAYVNREKTRALNLSTEADSDQQSRSDALRHLGMMLHTVQDFYLYTNYIELQLEDPTVRKDPYNMPLVDWSRVPDDYAGSRTGTKLLAFDTDGISNMLDKSSATASGGKTLVSGGYTQFSVACEMATRETQRQWKLFETLVKNRDSSRAAAILSALRNGDPASSGR